MPKSVNPTIAEKINCGLNGPSEHCERRLITYHKVLVDDGGALCTESIYKSMDVLSSDEVEAIRQQIDDLMSEVRILLSEDPASFTPKVQMWIRSQFWNDLLRYDFCTALPYFDCGNSYQGAGNNFEYCQKYVEKITTDTFIDSYEEIIYTPSPVPRSYCGDGGKGPAIGLIQKSSTKDSNECKLLCTTMDHRCNYITWESNPNYQNDNCIMFEYNCKPRREDCDSNRNGFGFYNTRMPQICPRVETSVCKV